MEDNNVVNEEEYSWVTWCTNISTQFNTVLKVRESNQLSERTEEWLGQLCRDAAVLRDSEAFDSPLPKKLASNGIRCLISARSQASRNLKTKTQTEDDGPVTEISNQLSSQV